MKTIVLIDPSHDDVYTLAGRLRKNLKVNTLHFSSLPEAQTAYNKDPENISALILNQRSSLENYSPLEGVPTIVITAGLPVQNRALLKGKQVIDFVPDTKQTANQDYIIELLRRNQDMDQYKILLAEDEQSTRYLVANLLRKKGMQVLEAANAKTALQLLRQHDNIRLIICDLDLPDSNGMELIRMIRMSFHKFALPVLAMSNQPDDWHQTSALRNGANDIVTKPFNMDAFQARVMMHLHTGETFRQLETLSQKDFLTELYNRRYFFKVGETLLANFKRGNLKIAVAMIDIDNFKQINDERGHPAGDATIVHLAGILQKAVRETDIVARLGGEEFAILASGKDCSALPQAMERILKTVSSAPVEFEGDQWNFTISMGLCLSAEDSLEGMLHIADQLLYQAKSQGKNRLIHNADKSLK